MKTRPSSASKPASWRSLSILSIMLAMVFGVSFDVTSALAQSQRIEHEQAKREKEPPPAFGRDLWLTMAQNYEATGGTGKYYDLYVTSPRATDVFIEVVGSTNQKFPIAAEQVLTFRIPLAWEITSSGKVEDKAIHVYSKNADLTAYVLSRNPATSDGMYINPSIGWGKENVVVSFQSIARSTGWDYPSEFCVMSNQNKSLITVTPTQDIRPTRQPDVVLHQKGVPFTDMLNRGQAIQYQLTKFQNADEWDATGTLVVGDKPVGTVGASQCPDIPVLFPWCDHICDIIPPVRTWAPTYYTAPFANRKGGDGYVVIGSKNGQTVRRIDRTGTRVHCVVNKYEPYFRHDIETPSRWESDAPFLLVQYINSTSWPGYDEGVVTNDGIGDPAMVAINPVEQYVNKVIFQTPTITGGASTFSNYVNIMVPKAAALQTKFDGKGILTNPRLDVDPLYDVYRLSNVKPGTHKVESTEGVGVYVYGYGSYDSYAWTANFGTGKFDDPDTIAPAAKITGDCYAAHVEFDDKHPLASKLSMFTLDSVYNMFYDKDPTFQDGTDREDSYYDMAVDDITKEAILVVTIYDVAGNKRTITSTYVPSTAALLPPVTDYGVGDPGKTEYEYVTITNTGKKDYKFTDLELMFNKEFRIDSADMGPLKVGESRRIKVAFTPDGGQVVSDTITFGDECGKQQAIVLGSGGDPDFTVTNVDFGAVVLGNSKPDDKQVVITNMSKTASITIVDIQVDKAHFKLIGPIPPINLAPDGRQVMTFEFTPQFEGPDQAVGTFTSAEVGAKNNQLIGRGIAPASTIRSDTSIVVPCPEPNVKSTFYFALSSKGSSQQKVTRVALTGAPNFDPADLTMTVGGSPITLPFDLKPGEEIVFTATFNTMTSPSGTYAAKLAVYDENDKLLDKEINMSARISIIQANAPKTNSDFGVLPFGTAVVTDVYTIENPGAEDLHVSDFQPDIMNSTAFAITNIAGPGGANAFPLTLKPGEVATVTIAFDPGKVPTEAPQTAKYYWITDACVNAPQASLVGAASFKGGSALGFTVDPIFACATQTADVNVTSSNNPTLEDEVIAVTVASGNAGNFVLNTPLPMKIKGGETKQLQYTFVPDAASAARTYSAVLNIQYRNAVGKDTTLVVTITGSAIGMEGVITSQFAQVNRTAEAGTDVALPIEFRVDKKGLTNDLASSAIMGVKLVYTMNTDILSKNDLSDLVKNTYADWAVDVAQSSIDYANHKLTLVISGNTPLADGVSKLGDLTFTVALPKEDNIKDVRLDEAEFRTVNNVPLNACFGSVTQSGDFTLIYACGDVLIQDLMNGKRTFASIVKPITPNPAVAGKTSVVTFTYAMRAEAPVSLTIFDMLGNEVARVVDGVTHPVGVYEAKLDVTKLQSGTYTCRFSAAGATMSETLVVTK